jgi:hypothetical protein
VPAGLDGGAALVGRVALVTRTDADVSSDLAALSAEAPELAGPDVEVLSPATLFFPEGAQQFACLGLGPSLLIFRTPWGRALLRQLQRLIAPGGALVLPFRSAAVSQAEGWWSCDDLADLFGKPPDRVGDGVAILRPDREIEPAPSVLSWYFDNCAGLIHHLLLATSKEALDQQRLDDLFLEFLYDDAERLVTRIRERALANREGGGSDPEALLSEKTTAPGYADRFARALRVVSGQLSALRFKAAVMKHLMQSYAEEGKAMDHLDIRGGHGYLSAELLMDPDLPLRRSVCCDPSVAGLAAASRMYRDLRPMLRNRFYFALKRPDDFAFDREYDVVSLLSSGTATEGRTELLDNCWRALAPGGILVTYEGQRSASQADALLERFGPVHRHSPQSPSKPLSASEAGEKSMFRVVVKPG